MNTVVVPGSEDAEGFVELARTSKGRLFRKQILHMNSEFVHPSLPSEKIRVTPALAASLTKNFDAGMCDIVQVPIVDGQNKHVEDPLRNLGEVIGLESDAKGVYALIDARKPELADELGKTLIGASAMMHMDYTDTRTGKHVGPTLLHVAVTNRPYLTNLEDFQEVVRLSADTTGDAEPAILWNAADSQEDDMPQTKEELIKALKDEHGVDVEALQAAPRQDELVAALSSVLREAGVVSLAAPVAGDEEPEITMRDVAEAVIELSNEKVQMASEIERLTQVTEVARQSVVETEVDGLVREGRILPKQRDKMVELAMYDRETFDALLPDQAIVSLSAEGVTFHEAPDSEKYAEETSRLLELANRLTGHQAK